jgi:endonuclease/exonuclease/phosphatase family metal-dependent hydrolase
MTTRPLRVMQFNIEYGGDGVDFSAVAKAITAADADIVAIQEGCGNVPQIAADLGWDNYDVRTQVVSKFPLLHPPSLRAGTIFVEVEPSRVVAVINVHPASRGYGPTRIGKGVDLERVLNRERKVRLSELEPSLAAARELSAHGIPVVLLGDFNAPSHRDWTENTEKLRPHMRYPVAWPTSVAAEDSGLVDVYRLHFPDPVSHPGLTWPADRPFVKGYNPAKRGDAEDRIDLMFAGPGANSLNVTLVGEVGSEYSDIVVEPWPTDHRAIVATFQFDASESPDVVSVASPWVESGSLVEVRYLVGGGDAAEIALVRPGGSEQVALRVPLSDPSRGVKQLPTSGLAPGDYDVQLRDTSGSRLARTSLCVAKPGTGPSVTTDKPAYRVDESIVATWRDAPGQRADWVAVYPSGADPRSSRRLVWTYTDATVTGSITFHAGHQPRRWPLPPGEYSVHLMADDLPVTLAQSSFTVNDDN